jgi:AraC-like DNA-binding protein
LPATGAAALAKTGGMAAARLGAIKADIDKHLACPELTVGAVAARQGITPRYVQLLFEREGTTFSDFVRGQRLVRACRMLGDPLRARWSITAIAFEAGFGDLSYFNRSFRRRYAACPSDVREAALRGQLRFNEPASSFLDKSEFAPVQDGHPERPTMCGASP